MMKKIYVFHHWSAANNWHYGEINGGFIGLIRMPRKEWYPKNLYIFGEINNTNPVICAW
jgi:hypothetical protein